MRTQNVQTKRPPGRPKNSVIRKGFVKQLAWIEANLKEKVFTAETAAKYRDEIIASARLRGINDLVAPAKPAKPAAVPAGKKSPVVTVKAATKLLNRPKKPTAPPAAPAPAATPMAVDVSQMGAPHMLQLRIGGQFYVVPAIPLVRGGARPALRVAASASKSATKKGDLPRGAKGWLTRKRNKRKALRAAKLAKKTAKKPATKPVKAKKKVARRIAKPAQAPAASAPPQAAEQATAA